MLPLSGTVTDAAGAVVGERDDYDYKHCHESRHHFGPTRLGSTRRRSDGRQIRCYGSGERVQDDGRLRRRN